MLDHMDTNEPLLDQTTVPFVPSFQLFRCFGEKKTSRPRIAAFAAVVGPVVGTVSVVRYNMEET